jgi:ubiquinone/menaquinone biosynthesis C-methylase UbiE
MGAVDPAAQERERVFHDELAKQYEATEMPAREPDALEKPLLDGLGDIRGLRVLDLGCGIGDLTMMLLDRGADVTALDISPGMVDVARRRAEHLFPAASFTGVAGTVEQTGLPDETFDLIVGKWILHHVELTPALAEMRRILAPGGRAAFVENSALNPLLMFARRHLAGRFGVPRLGTEDERPFDQADLDTFRREFPSFQMEFPDFAFFRMFDRQVLRLRFKPVTKAISKIEGFLYRRVSRLRKYSFHVIVRFQR